MPNGHEPESALLSRFTGLLVGQAVGDALGLPWEGLSRRRAERMYGVPDRFRLLPGRGMISDDTEHACMTAQAVLKARDDPGRFARLLAWKLKWWLAGLPAGTGWATSRAIFRLWAGVPPGMSGVHSAGNGPAMRAPVLGACFRLDEETLRKYIRASTILTHTDPKAEQGALIIALAAGWAIGKEKKNTGAPDLLDMLKEKTTDPDLVGLLNEIAKHLEKKHTVREFADSMGLAKGVSGYIYHSVPAALYSFLKHLGDYEAAVKNVVSLGGDTDSTAALTGALAGAAQGIEGIPPHLVNGIFEWPRSVSWMKRLAGRLAVMAENEAAAGPIALFWPGLIPRNLFFLAVVLLHGFRRMLPPY